RFPIGVATTYSVCLGQAWDCTRSARRAKSCVPCSVVCIVLLMKKNLSPEALAKEAQRQRLARAKRTRRPRTTRPRLSKSQQIGFAKEDQAAVLLEQHGLVI